MATSLPSLCVSIVFISLCLCRLLILLVAQDTKATAATLASSTLSLLSACNVHRVDFKLSSGWNSTRPLGEGYVALSNMLVVCDYCLCSASLKFHIHLPGWSSPLKLNLPLIPTSSSFSAIVYYQYHELCITYLPPSLTAVMLISRGSFNVVVTPSIYSLFRSCLKDL